MRKTSKKLLLKRIALLVITIFVILILFEVTLRILYPTYANYNTEMWRYASESKKISDFPKLGHEHVSNKSNMPTITTIETLEVESNASKIENWYK